MISSEANFGAFLLLPNAQKSLKHKNISKLFKIFSKKFHIHFVHHFNNSVKCTHGQYFFTLVKPYSFCANFSC